MAAKYCDWQFLADEIQSKLADPASLTVVKRQMGRIQPFPRVLSTLTLLFEKMVVPHELKFGLLWGLIYVNLKVKCIWLGMKDNLADAVTALLRFSG